MIDRTSDKLYAACCHHFCKTDKMTAEGFDDYSSEHCEDCPLGDLTQYYEDKIAAKEYTFDNAKTAAIVKKTTEIGQVIERFINEELDPAIIKALSEVTDECKRQIEKYQ